MATFKVEENKKQKLNKRKRRTKEVETFWSFRIVVNLKVNQLQLLVLVEKEKTSKRVHEQTNQQSQDSNRTGSERLNWIGLYHCNNQHNSFFFFSLFCFQIDWVIDVFFAFKKKNQLEIQKKKEKEKKNSQEICTCAYIFNWKQITFFNQICQSKKEQKRTSEFESIYNNDSFKSIN